MKMKIRNRIMMMILVVVSLIFLSNCSKDKVSNDDPVIPGVTTNAVTDITQSSAVCGGVLTSDGGSIVTLRGVCWSISSNPNIDGDKIYDQTGAENFSCAITGLTPGKTYFVRAFAIGSAGIGYGNEISFKTADIPNDGIIFNPEITYGTVTDIDGNDYKTVTIGTQTWMAENLRVTKYNDGTSIPNVTDSIAWEALTTGAYCNQQNDDGNSQIFGRLYNWYAVSTGKLCPAGWHIPDLDEWNVLVDYLGGQSIAGGKLKETGFNHWSSLNTNATNESGFTALPGGYRYLSEFNFEGGTGVWWSTNERLTVYADVCLVTSHTRIAFYEFWDKESGISVRCLKD
jgi:uncharacterized protein (TIGR02145 family)